MIHRVETAYPGRYVFLLPKDEFATIRAYYNTTVKQIKGGPDTDVGLTPMKGIGDCEFTTVERDGMHFWLVSKHSSPNYFYLKVADYFRPEPGRTLEIDLSYFDTGSGDVALDYDSTDIRFPGGGAFKRYPYAIHRMNSGQWKLARFYVSDAGFGGTENNADLRFYNDGDDLLISAVQMLRK